MKSKGIGKLNILLIIAAAAFLVLPTYLTYSLMKRNDAIEEKADEMVFSASKVNEVSAPIDMLSHSENDAEVNIQATTEVEAPIEKDTTAINPLTLVETATDAEESDSVEESTTTDAVPLNGKRVYLTFDDGPSDYTDELLDILAEYNVKATFFVVRNYQHPDSLRRIAEEGHTIGLHSASHEYSKLYADLDSFEKDVQGVHNWVEHLTGIDTRLYRFPGGSSNTVSCVPISECVEYLHENGYEYYDWNAESRDAELLYLTPEQLNENIMYSVRSNEGDSIVLMHDLDEHYNTVEALPDLIETLQSEGYELCTLGGDSPKCQHYITTED